MNCVDSTWKFTIPWFYFIQQDEKHNMIFFDVTEEEMLQFEDCPDPDAQDIVQGIREDFWANGYRPVAIASHDAKCRSPGKQPFLLGWADDARQSVPGCLERGVDTNQQNTGILCDGLRAIDIDVDDTGMVQRLRRVAEAVLGPDPRRDYKDAASRMAAWQFAAARLCRSGLRPPEVV